MYRLFSWEHSYFSGKARAYLRYKAYHGALGEGFEDVFATREILERVLKPATGSQAVPQLLAPEGTWVQDSSEIIDFCEARHPQPPVIPAPATRPLQCLASYLVELLADEWMVVYAFWERWHYSLEGVEPNHERFNAQQWGPLLAPTGSGSERRAMARFLFEHVFGIKDPDNARIGVYAGIRDLGVHAGTRAAWEASHARLMEQLEAHFDQHDFLLGGRPSLGDFGLLGPLYAHLFRDAVPGFTLRTRYPLVAEWVERTNGTNALNARSYNQKLYDVDETGQLVAKCATSHAGEWLPDDAIPETLAPVLGVFFEEMWPVLASSMEVLAHYMESDACKKGAELPGKTFAATPGFEALQSDGGALTHEFRIGEVRDRRMVLPYQVWMLQRLSDALQACRATAEGEARVSELLDRFERGPELLELPKRLERCRVKKVQSRIFADV
ncbi:MAG: glutathione S-transferase C-terminal domain-containing protein [Myxococcales bacterium]|nr:glutathione S-transferase C-terminal domain-containing protein [Myxococcales bacterium]